MGVADQHGVDLTRRQPGIVGGAQDSLDVLDPVAGGPITQFDEGALLDDDKPY